MKTLMVPPNKLGHDLNGIAVNKTQYRGFDLKGYSDSYYAGCNMDKKSTSGACQFPGGKLVYWSAKKQQSVAMSLAEAEYVVVAGCCANILWIKSQLIDYDIIYKKIIRDHILKWDIELHFIPTQYQPADIFTKPLDEPNFKRLIVELDQIEFTFKEIAFTTNNEVALLYPSHSNSKYFKEEDIIHKLNKKTRKKVVPYPRFISLLLEYMMPEYENEELTINPTQVFSVHNWALKPNQTEGPPFTDHMKAICNLDVHVDSKAPKPSLQTEEVPQGKNPGAKSRLRRKQSLKQIFESNIEASKSKTGQSEKEIQSSLAKDKNPSHTSPPTPVVGEMHKEAQQAAGGLTFLGATSEEGDHPQLSNQTKSSRDGLKTAHTDSGTNKESRADEISKKIKLEDLSDLLKDTIFAFFTPDFLQNEPIIVSDKSKEEEEVDKDKDTRATSHDVPEDTSIPHPPSLKSAQIQYLLNKVTETLNGFATVVENTSGATTKDVPSACQEIALPAEGEKNTNPAITDDEPNRHDELVDLLGIDVVTQYYKKKLLYDKYCEKMLKRRKSSKITNCDILTQKGPISLKVHREDETN
ncbi:hypothetical protein Tco_0763712 [Tanacetum coccineum]